MLIPKPQSFCSNDFPDQVLPNDSFILKSDQHMGKKARKAGAPVEADHGEKKKVKRGKKKGRKAAVKGKSKGGKRGILRRAGSSRHADVPDPEEEVQPRAKRSRMVKSAKKASDETAPKPKAKSARKPESGEETPAKPKRGRKAKSETAPAPEAKSAGKASAKTASKKKAPEAIAKRAPKAKSAPKAKARAIRAADEAFVVDPAEARDMVGLGPGPGNLNLDADLTTYLIEGECAAILGRRLRHGHEEAGPGQCGQASLQPPQHLLDQASGFLDDEGR